MPVSELGKRLRAAGPVLAAIVLTNGCMLFTSVSDLGPGTAKPEEIASDRDAAVADASPSSHEDAADAAPVTFEAPVVLAKEEDGPRSLVMDGEFVFWLGNGPHKHQISRASRTSTTGTSLVIKDPADLTAMTTLVVAPKGLFWGQTSGNSPSIMASDKAGGNVQVRGTLELAERLVQYGTTLYGSTSTRMWSAADSLVGPLDEIRSASGEFLTVDATSVFFAANGQILRIPKTGLTTSPDVVAAKQNGVRGIVSDETRLYWATDAGEISSVEKVGGTPNVLATGQAGPSSIAIVGDDLYWSNSADGTLVTMAKTGGPTTVIVKDQITPTNLIADASGLAWLDGKGNVHGMRRR